MVHSKFLLGFLSVFPIVAGKAIPDGAANPASESPLQALAAYTAPTFTPHARRYFYISGSYVANSAGEHTYQDQHYVEHLSPVLTVPGPNNKQPPRRPYILLLHGAAQTGTNWLSTPDGRPGWADHFLSLQYPVLIPDAAHRGRSPYPPESKMVAYSAEMIEDRFTATNRKKLWPYTGLHTQWPGPGIMGDKVFDAYYRSTVPLEPNNTMQQTWMREGLVALVQKVVKEDPGAEVVVVGHSQAGSFGWLLADDKRVEGRIKGYVAIEPSGPPFQNEVFATDKARKWGLADIEIRWEPAGSDFNLMRVGKETREKTGCWMQDPSKGVVKQLVGLRDTPMMVVTSESGYHRVYDYCTVNFLKQAGVKKVEFAELWKRGVRGGGHMMMMEKNSYDVWKVIEKWIREL